MPLQTGMSRDRCLDSDRLRYRGPQRYECPAHREDLGAEREWTRPALATSGPGAKEYHGERRERERRRQYRATHE